MRAVKRPSVDKQPKKSADAPSPSLDSHLSSPPPAQTAETPEEAVLKILLTKEPTLSVHPSQVHRDPPPVETPARESRKRSKARPARRKKHRFAARASKSAESVSPLPKILYITATLCSLLLFCFSIGCVAYFCQGDVLCEVSLNGRVVGYAESNAAPLAAVQEFEKEMTEELGGPYFFDGTFTYRLTTGRKTVTTPEEWRALLYRTVEQEYVLAAGLEIDGRLVAVVKDKQTATRVFDKILNEKNTLLAGENETIELQNSIRYVEKRFPAESVLNEEDLYLLLTEGDESLADLRGSVLGSALAVPSEKFSKYGATAESGAAAKNSVSVPNGAAVENEVNYGGSDSAAAIRLPEGGLPLGGSPSDALPEETQGKVPSSNIETGNKQLSFKTVTLSYEEVQIPFNTVYQETDDLYEGCKELQQAGMDGMKRNYVRRETVDGAVVSREILSSDTLIVPRDEIVLVGTKPIAATGIFLWPHKGTITSNLGNREIFGETSMHMGLDIDGRTGDDILAADGGVVTFAGYRDSYGYLTVIDHENGYETYYAHQSKLLVTAGDRVYQGQCIGLIGETGNAAGSHLHFELHKDGITIDPIPLLQAGEDSLADKQASE